MRQQTSSSPVLACISETWRSCRHRHPERANICNGAGHPHVEQDQGAAKLQERYLAFRQPLVPRPQAPEARRPRQRALRYPPGPAELLAALDAAARDPRRNPPRPTLRPTGRCIIGFVRVQLVRPLPLAADRPLDRLHGIEHSFERKRIGAVGHAEPAAQWLARAVDQDMVLAARPLAIRRVRASDFAPLLPARAGCPGASATSRSGRRGRA